MQSRPELATDPNNPQMSGSTQCSVYPPGSPPGLQSIAVTPANPTVTSLQSVTFTAMGTFTDGLDRNITSAVTWPASNANMTIGPTGIASPDASGTTTIDAVDPATNLSGAAFVTLSLPALTTLTINPRSSSFAVGNGLQLAADAEFDDGSTQTGFTAVTWASSGAEVDVDPSGEAIGKKQGAASVTATGIGSSVSASASITVLPPALRKITGTTADTRMPSGQGVEFTAMG